MERMRSISIITGSARLASAALVVLFVHRGADTVLAALLLSSGPLIAGMCGAGVALRLYVDRWVVPRRTDIFAMLREGRHLFLTTAAVSLYSNTNVVLVGLLSGNVEAGYFSLADKLIRAISGLVGPVIQAAYPRVVRLVVESKSAALVFVRKTLFWSAGLASVAGIFLYVAAGPIAILAFAPNDAALLTLIRCLSLFPLLTVITYILATLVMIPFGLDKEQSRWLLAIGFLNLVLGVMVIPHFGALGGVICMIVIEALQSVGALAILLRRGVLTVGPRLNIDFLDPMR
jgi:O-antigen/teichoic acid export membrane protein